MDECRGMRHAFFPGKGVLVTAIPRAVLKSNTNTTAEGRSVFLAYQLYVWVEMPDSNQAVNCGAYMRL